MLLRRVTEHVRAQNWFAVGIDFLIVVLGVFVGLQVANWNDERQDRLDEAYYLQRILDDINESIESNEEVLDFLKVRSRNAYWVAQKLRAGQLLAGEEALFKERFLGMENWQTGAFIDSTVQELQANGRMDIIQSTAFREALARFELELESYHRAQTNLADFLKELTLQISTQVDRGKTDAFYAALENDDLPRLEQNALHLERELLTSFQDMANNPVLIRHVDQYAEFYYWRRDNVAGLQIQLRALRTETLAALGRK